MQRYDTSIARKEGDYFYAQLHQQGFDKEFIFAVLNSFEEKGFQTAEFEAFDIELIVDYIQRTHAFYLQNKLPEIGKSILQLDKYYQSSHPLLSKLHSFFNRYYYEFKEHLSEEEDRLLPYIVMMRDAQSSQKAFSKFVVKREKYSISKFISGHNDTEDELIEIRKIIRMYTPTTESLILYNTLISQLTTFEQDLHVHALLEEEVLIPKALLIENRLNSKILEAGKLN